MCSLLSRIASNQRSVPLVIGLRRTEHHKIGFVKIKKESLDLCWLKNGRMFSVNKVKVKIG